MIKTSVIAFTVGLCILSIQAEDPGRSKSKPSTPAPKVVKSEVTPPFSQYWDSNSWEPINGPKFWKAGSKKKEGAKPLATNAKKRPSRSTRRGSNPSL